MKKLTKDENKALLAEVNNPRACHVPVPCHYGGITVEYKGNNQIQISPDKYNFEMHPWDSFKESMRNIETLIARPIHGKGISFPIYFRGLNTIHHAPATDNRPYVWSQYSWSRHF